MFAVLVLLFLAIPLIELAVIIQVGGAIGVLNTIGLLIAISVFGAWLVKREGLGVLRRIQTSLERHDLPHREVIDGGLILLAGALLLTPGFLTDVFGVLLLLPPTRAAVRGVVLHRLKQRATIVTMVGSTPYTGYYDTTARDHE